MFLQLLFEGLSCSLLPGENWLTDEREMSIEGSECSVPLKIQMLPPTRFDAGLSALRPQEDWSLTECLLPNSLSANTGHKPNYQTEAGWFDNHRKSSLLGCASWARCNYLMTSKGWVDILLFLWVLDVQIEEDQARAREKKQRVLLRLDPSAGPRFLDRPLQTATQLA